MQKRCPIDSTPLMEMNKNGVTIDVCPECKGVWLDRGELEKLISVLTNSWRVSSPKRAFLNKYPPLPNGGCLNWLDCS
jgi:uncharacterized protein